MKRIEPTIDNNRFAPDFMTKFIDEFEEVAKAREVMTLGQSADLLGYSKATVQPGNRRVALLQLGGLEGKLI